MKGGSASSPSKNRTQGQQFVFMALNMSWQLAVVVLLPVLAGVALGKAQDHATAWLMVGLAVALVGSIAVMWRTMRVANSLPVPKLSAAEKREVQKQYEEDDKE